MLLTLFQTLAHYWLVGLNLQLNVQPAELAAVLFGVCEDEAKFTAGGILNIEIKFRSTRRALQSAATSGTS